MVTMLIAAAGAASAILGWKLYPADPGRCVYMAEEWKAFIPLFMMVGGTITFIIAGVQLF